MSARRQTTGTPPWRISPRLRIQSARHELRCVECRVTWRSWLARLAGVGGYEPKMSRPRDDSIPVLISPAAVWACPSGHLNGDEDTCWCGEAMEWRVIEP